MQNPENVQKAIEFLMKLHDGRRPPRVGVVLGSGLGKALSGREVMGIDQAAIPGFPRPRVHSHSGRLSLMELSAPEGGESGAGIPIWALCGRAHLYEGFTPEQVCMGVRTLAGLGVDTLIITNAAGGLNPRFRAGTLMCIADHVNLQGASPLTGANHDAWGDRFPDMTRAYDTSLRAIAAEQARRLGVHLENGVYAGVPGPQLETPAETRMLRILGCDAVGMSTVQETLAARHMGVRVLGISCLTNINDPDDMAPVTHDNVVEVAEAAAGDMARLLAAVIGATA